MSELRNGAALLTLCLLYTALNQALSRRFFPKELCVAIIFAGGVIVFLLPSACLWAPAGALALLCLINCLMIGAKEQRHRHRSASAITVATALTPHPRSRDQLRPFSVLAESNVDSANRPIAWGAADYPRLPEATVR